MPSSDSTVLHVAERDLWLAARAAGSDYAPGAYAAEGFIHCCTAAQLAGVAQRYFAGRSDLVLLELAVDRLTAPLVWEGVTEPFPHVYGPIPPTAVLAERPLAVDASGTLVLSLPSPPGATG